MYFLTHYIPIIPLYLRNSDIKFLYASFSVLTGVWTLQGLNCFYTLSPKRNEVPVTVAQGTVEGDEKGDSLAARNTQGFRQKHRQQNVAQTSGAFANGILLPFQFLCT